MMFEFNYYLQKEDQYVADVVSYKASKEKDGSYTVSVFQIAPTSFAVKQAIDITELRDFDLICQTSIRRIRYHIPSWCDECYPVEADGVIVSCQAFHCTRTETPVYDIVD